MPDKTTPSTDPDHVRHINNTELAGAVAETWLRQAPDPDSWVHEDGTPQALIFDTPDGAFKAHVRDNGCVDICVYMNGGSAHDDGPNGGLADYDRQMDGAHICDLRDFMFRLAALRDKLEQIWPDEFGTIRIRQDDYLAAAWNAFEEGVAAGCSPRAAFRGVLRAASNESDRDARTEAAR